LEVLNALGLLEATKPKIVQGENIAQTFQFVITGNAELGFVALSQVTPGASAAAVAGSWWVVPASLYTPIRQDAVLLKPGEGRAAASALLKYLRSDKAKAVIRACGYEI
jgi:molybdate transport system substrate-binding protein